MRVLLRVIILFAFIMVGSPFLVAFAFILFIQSSSKSRLIVFRVFTLRRKRMVPLGHPWGTQFRWTRLNLRVRWSPNILILLGWRWRPTRSVIICPRLKIRRIRIMGTRMVGCRRGSTWRRWVQKLMIIMLTFIMTSKAIIVLIKPGWFSSLPPLFRESRILNCRTRITITFIGGSFRVKILRPIVRLVLLVKFIFVFIRRTLFFRGVLLSRIRS